MKQLLEVGAEAEAGTGVGGGREGGEVHAPRRETALWMWRCAGLMGCCGR